MWFPVAVAAGVYTYPPACIAANPFPVNCYTSIDSTAYKCNERDRMNIIKLICLTGLSALFLGCASPVSDMLNNEFLSIKPTTPPAPLPGFWTGTVGPFLTTLQFTESGNGYMCHSGATNVISKTKYTNGEIFLQGGTRLEVINLTSEKLVANSPYGFGSQFTFYPDDDLNNASIYCGKELAGS